MEEKKRKRGNMRNSSSGGSNSVSDIRTAGDESPSKKLRNSELDLETIDGTRKVLPKSIASLYESILSAQKELEAGKGWEAEAFEKM